MAQGAIKKAAKSPSSRKSSALGPKRGARVIAPKKRSLIMKKNVLKKHSAGLTAMTEKNLAEKAGHLEILKGGKKDAKDAKKAKKAKK